MPTSSGGHDGIFIQVEFISKLTSESAGDESTGAGALEWWNKINAKTSPKAKMNMALPTKMLFT